MGVGSISSMYLSGWSLLATVPPTRTFGVEVNDPFPQTARLSGPISSSRNGEGNYDVFGLVVLGDVLYSNYSIVHDDGVILAQALQRIGGGWSSYIALDTSTYSSRTASRLSYLYGLRRDGVLFRWNARTWGQKTSYPGFSAVKSMALISSTATYDTFLATTRGGALYTIHIPVTSPMKPVVKLVRRSTWQGFEALLARKCGIYGTLLLGIDKDTQSGYLYAVGHANGTSTVIQSRGKVPWPLGGSAYARWSSGPESPPFGE
ncbi:hypothetical protein E0H50_29210 [Kribbella sindirgiensis]|uniref:Uncharacterized protein n=1 Tax=Kribbella sindirgiensis TaxID=1124744 RepID=A0A4R0I866_9ACTN|nr:hypothetical protein E0H50_29210 [Kribbella sindirgiensis]